MTNKSWDPPGLEPRDDKERCANHSQCAYRDDDPTRCPHCHRRWELPSMGCRCGSDAAKPINDYGRLHPPTPAAIGSERGTRTGRTRR